MPENQSLTRPLKIAYVVDIFDDNGVGAVQSSRRFAEGLMAQGHELTIISTGEPREGKVCIPAQKVPGLQWIVDKNGFAFGTPSRDILRKALPGHDVVYIHYSLMLGWGALSVARELGLPVIFGYHFQPQNILYNLRIDNAWLDNLMLKFFVKHFYNRANHVICPSEHALQELQSAGFNRPHSVITNGLPERFKPISMEKPAELQDKFVILTVGRLSHEKRHDLIIKAIKQSKYADKIKYIATGKGPTEDLVRKLSLTLPVPADVGYVSDEKLIELYNTADLLVHASQAELEGMAVLEAIGCGLPALIADDHFSATSQFAIDERFLFTSGDADGLTRKIDYLIERREELQAARQAYIKKAGEFRFDAALEKEEDLFYKIAGIEPPQRLAPVEELPTLKAANEG